MRYSFVNWLTISLIASLSMTMTSCSSDDKIESDSLTAKLQANKWICKDASYGEGSNYHAWVDIETTTLYFTTDNTGVAYWIQKDYDTDLGYSRTSDYSMFNYSVSGNSVTLKDEKNYVTTYTYQDGCLVYGSIVYVPSPMSSSDYEFARNLGPQTGSCGKDLQYSFDDRTGVLTISGSGRMNDYTATNQPWHNFAINEIIIKDGCKYVGTHAFNKLTYSVGSLSIANSVQEIGDYAFSNLYIEELIVPDDLMKIGDYAFSDCTYLKKLYWIGCDALEEIGDFAFGFCPINEYSLTIPKNVKKIGSNAFFSSTISGRLTLNEKLETVGITSFGRLNISKLEIPNSVKYIGSLAFRGSFSEIRIGTGLTSFGENPFLTSSSGKMYVNLGQPLTCSGDIIANDYGNAAGSWTLYVPKGSKSAYQNAEGWKSFKSIIEDSSLVSGNGTPQDGGGDNTGGSGDDPSVSHSGTHNGHEYVDLGLSVKWATCNVGATKPEGYGGYYAWGETDEKYDYDWSTYRYCDGTKETCHHIGDNIAGTYYDVAHVKWGGSWRMPSSDEINELKNKCTYKWTTQNGVYGLLVTGPNGRNIFLPAAGYHFLTFYNFGGDSCYYWSSSLYPGDESSAYARIIDSNGWYLWSESRLRYIGCSVRPVCP